MLDAHHLRRWWWPVGLAVGVSSVDTNWALILVLEEPEVGVVGGGLASDASTGTDEAWANIDGVCIAGLHVDRRESWERTRSGLVVVCCLRAGAAAWVVASPEERTWDTY